MFKQHGVWRVEEYIAEKAIDCHTFSKNYIKLHSPLSKLSNIALI
jgi:hypothetical protein